MSKHWEIVSLSDKMTFYMITLRDMIDEIVQALRVEREWTVRKFNF